MPTPNAPTYQTVNDIFFTVADSGSADVVRAQQRDGSWQTLSSADLYARLRASARGIAALGLRKGDRVAIISENRWEWAVADFAALALGIVDVPLFPTLQAQQVTELLQHSGARVAVVSTAAQLAKVNSARGQTSLEHVFVMDSIMNEAQGGESFSRLLGDCSQGRDAEFDAQAHSIFND